MASNFKDCPTGILIDFIGETTNSNSSNCNEKEHDTLNGKADKVKSSHEKEETSNCQASIVNSCNNPGNSCLGDELTKINERDAWSGWRTPSPTTMNMINEEALRIVDQLHTSLEISLWDEEFPLTSTVEEDCSEEYYESVLSHNVASNSLNFNTLSCDVNVIKKDIFIETELAAKCLSTNKEDFSSIEKNIVTKETRSHRNPSVLSVNFNVTETNIYVNKNSGSIGTTEGSSGSSKKSSDEVEGSSGAVEGSSGNVKENSGIYKKNSSTPNESSGTSMEKFFIKEHCIDPTEGYSDAFEGNSDTLECRRGTLGESSIILERSSEALEESSEALEESSEALEASSGALEGSSGALEGSSGALKASSGALEASSEALEASSDTLEKNCSANKKYGATEKYYANASEEISCDKVRTKNICNIIKASCLVIEESSFITEDNSTATEEIKAIAVMNSNMMAKCSNVGDSNSFTDIKQKHLSSESIINENNIKSTPNKSLNMKSKLVKVFKGSALKTPINHNKAKENLFQASKDKNALSENRICKIGPAKSILGESNLNGSEILTSKPNIKTPLNKRILEKIPFARRENKPNMNMSLNQSKQIIKQPNAPMKSTNSLQFPPTSSIKTPLCKSNSAMDTPNLVKPIRRSNSFQTRSSIENFNHLKREKSFVAVSHLKTLNSRMPLHQTTRIGSDVKTPLKNSSFLPKNTSNTFATPFSSNVKSCVKASQIACPSFGSALKQINTPIPGSKQVLGFKRPASTTSKTRFSSRLELPSPLTKAINDSIPRRLFPDNTPKKR